MANHSDKERRVENRIMSLAECMRVNPHRIRICGWDPENPPEVEKAFRAGFVVGASRCAACDLEEAADFTDRMSRRRGRIYWGLTSDDRERWSDRRAAVLRGAMQGGLEAVRARAAGVRRGLRPWQAQLHMWAAENPIRLEWRSAKPPDAPEPDSEALGRREVPRRLWSEVFGFWSVMAEPTKKVAGE
jgi:hypothetical protein